MVQKLSNLTNEEAEAKSAPRGHPLAARAHSHLATIA